MAGSQVSALPKLVVFDLDYTLWPFWVDTHVDPPFRKHKGKILDSRGRVVQCYADVNNIFTHLKSQDIKIGVASRTTEIQAADQLVDLFGWNDFVNGRQIYPGSKIPHFNRFHQHTGIPYHDMLFYDDEHRNIREVSRLGVTCIHCSEGISMDVFKQGLETFAKKRAS